jgi:hypothetical protein
MDRKVTLYCNHWYHPDGSRRSELDGSLVRNAANPAIDAIVVLAQSQPCQRPEFPSGGEKVVWMDVNCSQNQDNRPTFRNFFDEVNRRVETPYDLNIVSNSDIIFDDSIRLLKPHDLELTCVALSRWDGDHSGQLAVRVYDNCQDAWIFQGRVRPLGWCDFPMGCPACDWRLNWELMHSDYRLINPCYDVRAIHNHPSGIRGYGARIDGHAEAVRRCTLKECNLQPLRPSKAGAIAYSLYGSDSRYTVGAIRNAELARHVYPGWALRYYVDSTVPGETVTQLRNLKTEIVTMPDNVGFSGTFWRFLIAEEPGFQRWMIRDADSRLNYRERRAVDDWIESGLDFHIIRDHPQHRRKIMGCAFGGLRGTIPQIRNLIDAWEHKSTYCNDEDFLEAKIWPLVKDRALIHSDYDGCPFPTEREAWRFVGERCYHDEHWHHGDRWAIF